METARQDRASGRRASTVGREIAATLALAGPLVLSNLAGTALGTIDVILIGRLGPEPLAAAALATTLYLGTYLAGLGLVSAVSPLVAAEFGRRRHAVREIRRTTRQGAWSAVVFCAPAWLFLWNGDLFLRAVGEQANLAATAGAYIRALLPALLPQLLFVVLRAFTTSLNRPLPNLVVALAALPVNLGLAYALVFGRFGFPALGLTGAAFATVATAWLSVAALLVIIAFDRRLRRYHILGRFWRPDWPRFRALWRLGVPIAATIALETSLFSAAGLAIGHFGASALAAHAVALQIASLCFMVPLGLGQAATVRVGQAFGAGDRHAIGRAGWTAFALAMVFMATSAGLLFSAPRALVSLFIDADAPANAETVRLAVTFLALAAMFQLADGAQVVSAGMLRGLQDTRVPLIVAAIGYWAVGAPVGLLLGFGAGWGGSGVWTGLAVGLAVVAILLLIRWSRRELLATA